MDASGTPEIAETEVPDDGPGPVVVEKHVLELDVSVDDSSLVDVLQTAENLLEVDLGHALLEATKSAVSDEVAKCSTLVQVHRKAEIVGVRADLVKLDDVGVTESGHDLGLSLQILGDVGIVDISETYDFQSDL